MFNQENENLQYIVKDKNLLLYSENNLEHLRAVFNMFNNVLVEEATEFTIQNLNTTISKNSIDIIIVNSKEFKIEIYETLLDIINYEELYIFLCHNQEDTISEDLINLSNSTFTNKISEDLFSHKLYTSMQNRILNVDKTNLEVEETYVDSFEIEIIFIRDELLYVSKRIDNGDISKNVFLRITQSINRINHIFENYLIYSEKIKKSMIYLSRLLSNTNLDNIDEKNLESFDHLSRIIEDIATFLDNYFIKRSFNDLYVVEDSLANSLKFLKISFEQNSNKEDGSSLEFFYD